jgi:hypothetical protein
MEVVWIVCAAVLNSAKHVRGFAKNNSQMYPQQHFALVVFNIGSQLQMVL